MRRPQVRWRSARGVHGLSTWLSAQLAIEGESHLPLHPAVVRADGPPDRAAWSSGGGRRDHRRAIARPRFRARPARCATLRCGAIAETRFVPEKGRNRIGAMVEGRPDWVLSRQRAWGVPITLFVDRKSGQYLVDPEVNDRIIAAIREGGS